MSDKSPQEMQLEKEVQMVLFGEGDTGDLTPEEVPVMIDYGEYPGGVIIEAYKDAYPVEESVPVEEEDKPVIDNSLPVEQPKAETLPA